MSAPESGNGRVPERGKVDLGAKSRVYDRKRTQKGKAATVRGWALVAAVVLLALVALGVWRGGQPPDPTGAGAPTDQAATLSPAEAAATEAYLATLEPVVEDGGRVVYHGLRAGVPDIAQGAFPDETLQRMASSWVEELRGVAARLAAAEPPPSLADAHRELVAALDAYVEVARTLLEAAEASGDERLRLAELAADGGRAADALWDGGVAELQQRLRALGVPPVTWLMER